MNNELIHLNTQNRSDDQMMEVDLIPSDGRARHFAIASVVVRMDGQESDSPDLVSFAERLVSRYNACAGMADPAAEIAELKRQRDELLNALQDAATSLETIQLRSFGEDSYLDNKSSMRLYAGARAAVARSVEATFMLEPAK